MLARRAIGLLVLAILPLSGGIVPRACGSSAALEAVTAHDPHAEHASHDTHDAATSERSENDGDAPRCCPGMATCGLTMHLVAAAPDRMFDNGAPHLRKPGTVARSSASRAPEPPPPRAQARV